MATVSVWLVLTTVLVGTHVSPAVLPDGDAIEGEYMLLLKENAPVSSLGEVMDGVEIVVEQQMGEYTFLHVRMNPNNVMALDDHPSVEIVEQDRRVAMENDPVEVHVMDEPYNHDDASETEDQANVCRTQSPGTGQNLIYGLVRTSSRTRPSSTTTYRYGLTGRGVDIYVVDSGVDVPHVDFSGRSSHGFVSSEWQGEGYIDLNGHGTNVASLAGGSEYGVAKEANLINVKVLGASNRGSWSGIASGVNYVANRVRGERAAGRTVRPVINMSIYGTSYSSVLYSAISAAVSEGVIVLACAGNDAADTRGSYPAAFDNTIAVGATDINDNFASFSNWGSLVEISAPGVSTYAAWSTNSRRCATATPYRCYAFSSGTSMATPLVAGVVARYLEGLTDTEMAFVNQETIRQMLRATSSNGYINFSNNNQRTTPNKIVYRECAFQSPA